MPKLGKLPPDHSRPALKFASILTAAPSVPAVWDQIGHVPSFPMLGNDQYGDCVEATCGHSIETWTFDAQNAEATVTEQDVLAAYSAITGFNPNDPNSDQGTVIQDALGWWRKNHIAGHTIVAFAKVDHTNIAELEAAVYFFGQVNIGFSVPQSAMDQFNAGKPWTVVGNDGGIIGGHSVPLGAYDQTMWHLVTWGQIQQASREFIAKYADEAWVVLTQDMVNALTQSTPEGLDLTAWGEEWATLTGEPNPFPVTPPGPTPPPVPVPTPTPSPADIADQALAPLMARLSQHHWHHITSGDAQLINAWLVDKGFA